MLSALLTLWVGGCTIGLSSSVGRGAILAARALRLRRRAFFFPGWNTHQKAGGSG